MPAKWIVDTYRREDERKDYIFRHTLDGVTPDLKGFEAFYKARRERLLEKIVAVLNSPTEMKAVANG
jgi:hypothetical protein